METENDACPEGPPNTPSGSQSTSSENVSLFNNAFVPTSSNSFKLSLPQSSDSTSESDSDLSNADKNRTIRYTVPDLPSLCFPMIHAASLHPIDLSQPLPISHIGNDPNLSEASGGGEEQGLIWNQFRSHIANYNSFASYSRHRFRVARKQIFYKMGLQRHWSDERKLIAAVLSSEATRVIQLLNAGANPNVCDQKKRTPLHIATSQGQDYVASVLLSKRADPNRQDILGNTPLHLAVCRGDRTTVKILIDNGANIFMMDNNGRTPISLARSRLGTLRRDQSLPADKLKSEFLLISDFLYAQAKRESQESATTMDGLCQMMKNVSTREHADEIADVVFDKMSDMSLGSESKPKPSKPLSPFHSIL